VITIEALWWSCTVLVGMLGVVHRDVLPASTSEARWALWLLMVIAAPLVVVTVILACVAKAVLTLATGFRNLYRDVVPRKPKVPEARVVERRGTP
jgi:hypothetical protein